MSWRGAKNIDVPPSHIKSEPFYLQSIPKKCTGSSGKVAVWTGNSLGKEGSLQRKLSVEFLLDH